MGCRVASGPDQTLPFRYFKTSPEIIRLAVMLYIRFPPSLRNVEDMMHERGIDICHETVRFFSSNIVRAGDRDESARATDPFS